MPSGKDGNSPLGCERSDFHFGARSNIGSHVPALDGQSTNDATKVIGEEPPRSWKSLHAFSAS